jgi:hypothetical protein
VDRVEIAVDHGKAVATVSGVAHRMPRHVRVPLGLARRLIAAGVPSMVRVPGDGRTSVVG